MWSVHPEGIRRALGRIDPVFLGTPVLRSSALDRLCGAELLFKDETANPIRSFKGRGACNLLGELAPENGLVCASAGNFGQGIAWAAARHGVAATVFASTNAVGSKIDAMRALGAEVVLQGEDFDAAKEAARLYAQAEGALFLEDGAHAALAEGAGTIGLELTDEVGEVDSMVCPLGNGALAAGLGCWMVHSVPAARVTAVGASGAPAMVRSVEEGIAISTSSAETIADGIAVRSPIPSAVAAVRKCVHDLRLVDDDEIRLAMRILKSELGVTVEPAGAVGLAAMLTDPESWHGKRVFIPLCGGNV